MAFPTVVNSANTTGSGTSMPLTMPASIVAARLLLSIVASNTDESATQTMTGWTNLGGADRGASGDGSLTAFAKAAAGSDTGTVAGANAIRAITTYQISGWSGTLTDVKVVFAAVSTLDPPSLSVPSADDYLWIAAVRGTANMSSAPTNYGSLVTTNAFGFTSIGSAIRNLNATSDNPGVFGGSEVSNVPVAGTIAVLPGAPPTLAPPPRRNRYRHLLVR